MNTGENVDFRTFFVIIKATKPWKIHVLKTSIQIIKIPAREKKSSGENNIEMNK